jgi:hypothetical protein
MRDGPARGRRRVGDDGHVSASPGDRLEHRRPVDDADDSPFSTATTGFSLRPSTGRPR